MRRYSYQDCLETSYRVNWRIDDVLGAETFDFARPWLPPSLSAAGRISCLNEEEKRKLTHVEMGAYAHLFGFVEEFIAPQMTSLAQAQEQADRGAFEALANFVAEEVKHMHLFRRIRDRVDAQLGFRLRLLDGEQQVADYVLGKNTGAVLLLTSCIEWFTQLHYLAAIREAAGLDPLTKKIFRAHWLEESQHAKLDHLETLRAFATMGEGERDRAVSDLIELVGAVDGLLQKQSGYDLENLSRYLGRDFKPAERDEIGREVLAVKRWVFILSGVTHPNFNELFLQVTTSHQRERVALALAS
ncbi:MAG TPA: diiron oxygenase [bacterium]|nr:diiron oxygenase [bacterium]